MDTERRSITRPDGRKIDFLVAGPADGLPLVLHEGTRTSGTPAYRLMVFPLILGTGKRLFDGAARTSLKLADVTRIGPDGVTIQRYTPAGS